jgi:hypothetical protein
MTEDFRSQRMPSPEGQGKAKSRLERAWDGYAKGVNKVVGPVTAPLTKSVGSAAAVDLMGFWLCWQTEGGFEGLQRMGMSRSAIYRRIGLFRKLMGIHPDEYQMPGVTIDVAAYLAGTGMPSRRAAMEAKASEADEEGVTQP